MDGMRIRGMKLLRNLEEAAKNEEDRGMRTAIEAIMMAIRANQREQVELQKRKA